MTRQTSRNRRDKQRPGRQPARPGGTQPSRPRRTQAEPGSSGSAAAKLFDLRVLIGGLFTLYGVILIVAGIFASAAERQKASGININLWMGIGMLVLGLLFLLWWRLKPLPAPAQPAHERARPQPRRH